MLVIFKLIEDFKKSVLRMFWNVRSPTFICFILSPCVRSGVPLAALFTSISSIAFKINLILSIQSVSLDKCETASKIDFYFQAMHFCSSKYFSLKKLAFFLRCTIALSYTLFLFSVDNAMQKKMSSNFASKRAEQTDATPPAA